MLDEFTAKEMFANNGYWANKYGIQLGGKYFDAFGVRNLDLQAELNMVRPYTYSHYDSTSNYTHYNQPLAHPLGADFRAEGTRLVGTRTFALVDGMWTDARYTKSMRTVRVKPYSAAGCPEVTDR